MGFQGRLVAGVGKSLRIYDIGKKKLLRKVENKVMLLSLACSLMLIAITDLCLRHCELEYPGLPNNSW